MGKSCSKHGNIDIDYDTVTSRAEPEGQCLSPNDGLFEASRSYSDDARNKSPELCVEDDPIRKRGCLEYGLSSDKLHLINQDVNHEPFYETQLIVDLPPSDDEVTNKKISEATDHDLEIKDSATQTPVIEVSHSSPKQQNSKTENETTKPIKSSDKKDYAESVQSSTTSSQDEWSYTLYDFEGRGSVGSSDLTQLMQSICTVVGQSVGKGGFKVDKENRALKLRLAIGRQPKQEMTSVSKPKAGSDEFSRMLFPPPESEEAARLSSYIEEKLSVHTRGSGRRDRSNLNSLSPNDVCSPAGASPKKSRCGCIRRDKREKPVRTVGRRRYGSEQAKSHIHGDLTSHTMWKEHRSHLSKREAASFDRCKFEKPPCDSSTTYEHECTTRPACSANRAMNVVDDPRFTVPKRQETYPGASTDTDDGSQVHGASSRDSVTGKTLPETRPTNCNSSETTCSKVLLPVNTNDPCHTSHRHHRLDNQSFGDCSERDTLSTVTTPSDVHELKTGWGAKSDSSHENTRESCCLIESLHPKDSVRWIKAGQNHSAHHRTTNGIANENFDVLDNSRKRSLPLCCNRGAQEKLTRQMKDRSECCDRFPGDMPVNNCIWPSKEDSTGCHDKASVDLSISDHWHDTQQRLPGLQEAQYSDMLGSNAFSSCWAEQQSYNPAMGNSADRGTNRNRKTKCPCHFRSSQLKKQSSILVDSPTFQQETHERTTQHSTHGAHRMLPTHTFSNHTHSCYPDVDNIYDNEHMDTPHESTRIQHIYRHEHHHYHYYLDNHM